MIKVVILQTSIKRKNIDWFYKPRNTGIFLLQRRVQLLFVWHCFFVNELNYLRYLPVQLNRCFITFSKKLVRLKRWHWQNGLSPTNPTNIINSKVCQDVWMHGTPSYKTTKRNWMKINSNIACTSREGGKSREQLLFLDIIGSC